jgi:chromosomal replication initiator protein
MYLARLLTPRSLPEIGRRFGGRDHTTIIHGIRRIDHLCSTDSELRADVETLSRELRG